VPKNVWNRNQQGLDTDCLYEQLDQAWQSEGDTEIDVSPQGSNEGFQGGFKFKKFFPAEQTRVCLTPDEDR